MAKRMKTRLVKRRSEEAHSLEDNRFAHKVINSKKGGRREQRRMVRDLKESGWELAL